MVSWMGGIGRALRTLHDDERGAEGLEKILILAAIALPLLGLLIWFKDDLAGWIKSIWGEEKTRGNQKLYDDGGAYGGN